MKPTEGPSEVAPAESGTADENSEAGRYFAEARAQLARNESSYSFLNAVYAKSKDITGGVPGLRTVRLAILRNVTVEPWLPALFGQLLERGFFTRFWVGDFNVYENQVLDPASTLYEHDPDVILIHQDFRALVGDAFFRPPPDIEVTLIDRIENLVVAALEHSRAHVVLTTLAPYPFEYFAPYSYQVRDSWVHRRRAINVSLVERFQSESRVHLLDLDDLASRFGVKHAYDQRLYVTARSPFSVDFLPHIGRGLASIVKAIYHAPRKCLVVDCDNVLWGGILGEDGPDGLRLNEDYPGAVYREFQRFLKALHDRGFLLALSSKNNEADVIAFIESSPDMVLRMDDFTAWRINWEDKATNLREIVEEINIGLDAAIFIDDSDFECELVASVLPEVQVEKFPSDPLAVFGFIEGLRNTEVLHVTPDDLKRGASYKASVKTERLRKQSTDLGEFLRNLQITLTITKQDHKAVQRISQLTQRTNQFNLTTRRYPVEDVARLFETGSVYTMSMQDRFSDHGTIAVAIVVPRGGGPTAVEIDTFLMSCRAFGRGVETAFLREVLSDLRTQGVELVRATYQRTARNGMVRDFYLHNGFLLIEEAEDARVFECRLGAAAEGLDGAPYTIVRVGF